MNSLSENESSIFLAHDILLLLHHIHDLFKQTLFHRFSMASSDSARTREAREHDKAIKEKFRKRKMSLCKKIDELTYLCDSDVYLVIFRSDRFFVYQSDMSDIWSSSGQNIVRASFECLLIANNKVVDAVRWQSRTKRIFQLSSVGKRCQQDKWQTYWYPITLASIFIVDGWILRCCWWNRELYEHSSDWLERVASSKDYGKGDHYFTFSNDARYIEESNVSGSVIVMPSSLLAYCSDVCFPRLRSG